ncbi:MFS general substrate transporter [Backusella circina FSU 941]|nr:MFS general substrate transporter [Backusella circina FSU 941]
MLYHYRSHHRFIFLTASFALFTSSFVHSILFSLSPFIVSQFRTEELDSKDTGILVALYGRTVGSPLFGWMGDRQRRLPLVLGTILSILANIFFILSINYPMLLVARFLQGLGNASVWTLCLCLVVDHWPKENLGKKKKDMKDAHFFFFFLTVTTIGAQTGKLVCFYPIGMVVGLPAGGKVLYNELGHQAPFIISMILCIIDFTLRLLLLERSKAPLNDIEKNEKIITTLHPPHNLHDWHFSATECSFMILAYLVPSIIASYGCGWLCDVYGTKIVALLSLLLATPFCMLIGIPNHSYSLVPVLIMSGVAFAGCQAPVFPEIAKVVNNENGLAKSFSLFNAAFGIGN